MTNHINKIGLVLVLAMMLPLRGASEPDSTAAAKVSPSVSRESASLRDAVLIDSKRPMSFEVTQNYPNPFNSETLLQYSVPHETEVNVTIHNIFGLPVRHLVRRQQQAGHYVVQWNGEDDNDNSLASGVYFSVVVAGDYAAARKMVLVK